VRRLDGDSFTVFDVEDEEGRHSPRLEAERRGLTDLNQSWTCGVLLSNPRLSHFHFTLLQPHAQQSQPPL
jgi:pullulanase/glycogen debranching enzyme